MILIAAFFPATNGVFVQAFAFITERRDDLPGSEMVVEHFIDTLAQFFGQAHDGAAARTAAERIKGILDFGFSIFDLARLDSVNCGEVGLRTIFDVCIFPIFSFHGDQNRQGGRTKSG